MEDDKQKNYYEILETPMDSTQEDIQKAYLRAKNAYSQDSLALYSLMTAEDCQKMSNLIDEAHLVLSDPAKRKEYDRVRGFNQNMQETQNFVPPKEENKDFNLENKIKDAQTAPSGTMGKIVARKQYALEFKVDNDFEKEIESASEFTGDFLSKIREYKNVDIKRMSDMTKVSKTYLQYIESEQFNKLPAPIYVRGFVYQFAKCLKLSPDLVANSYVFRMKQALGKS